MPIRRLTSAAVVAAFLAVLGASATAQVPGVLKRISKAASTGPKTPPPAPVTAPKPTITCSQITGDMLDQFLKGQAAWKATHDAEIAKANAYKAKADALAKDRATATMNAMMKADECKDAFKEKDPRRKEINRLESLVAAADGRGDEAKSEELRKKLDPLNEALELDADRACGGKGSSALHDCLEKKQADLAKQGVSGPMLAIQAHGECASDPATSGIAGASAPSQAEQDATDAYNQGMKDANQKADEARKKEEDAMGLDDHQRALFLECILGVLNRDQEVSRQMPTDIRVKIEKHEPELHDIR
jgi:hypothetical protein